MKPIMLLEMERLRDLNSGLGQFCHHLGAQLVRHPDFEWKALLPSARSGIFGEQVQYFDVHPIYKWWPFHTRAQIWHCTHQQSAYWPRSKETKVVLTIHDLNFLEGDRYPQWRKDMMLRSVQNRIRKASGLVFISEYVRRQAMEALFLPLDTPQRVIYNGNCLEAESEVAQKPKSLQVTNPFVFSIGVHQKKQYDRLLPLLARTPDLHWVIAGRGQAAYEQLLKQEAMRLGIIDRLHLIGSVSEPEKLWLYRNCEALWFPSGAEGFGLPVVEALSVGKPAFLWKGTSLPEVGGAFANYWSSFEVEHLVAEWQRGMMERSRDAKFAEGAKKWAAQFSWEKAAKQYIELYQEVLKPTET